jgi:hypothetical protein
MKADEVTISKQGQMRDEANEEYKKWNARLKAQKDRYNTCKKYLDFLSLLEEKLKLKAVFYKENCEKGRRAITDLSS